jgi:hypothetical protein
MKPHRASSTLAMLSLFAIILVLTLAAAACGGGASPLTPSGPPTAVLAVSTFTARLVPPTSGKDYVDYDVKLRLSETTGKSGATLKTIKLSALPSGNSGSSSDGCWPKGLRIAPGETWDMESLGYCIPEVSGRTEDSSVSLVVTFTDDDGRSGQIQGSATVTR